MTHQDVPAPLDADAPEANAVAMPLRPGSRRPATERPEDATPFATWRRPLLAVRRYKWLVLAITLVGSAAGVAVGRMLHPSYHARATVWIQVPPRPVRTDGPMWQGQPPLSAGWVGFPPTNRGPGGGGPPGPPCLSPHGADRPGPPRTLRGQDH